MGSALSEAGSELERLRRERATLSDALDRAGEAARSAASGHSAQLSVLTDSLRALDRQAKGSQAMLASAREQCAALEAANVQLRGELDAMYAQSLGGGGGGGYASGVYGGAASSTVGASRSGGGVVL